MKKQKFIKEKLWEMHHNGLRVRIVASDKCEGIDVEVFDDRNGKDLFFKHFNPKKKKIVLEKKK